MTNSQAIDAATKAAKTWFSNRNQPSPCYTGNQINEYITQQQAKQVRELWTKIGKMTDNSEDEWVTKAGKSQSAQLQEIDLKLAYHAQSSAGFIYYIAIDTHNRQD